MARQFSKASVMHLYSSEVPVVTARPFTFSIWFNQTSGIVANGPMMSTYENGTGHWYQLSSDSSDKVVAAVYNGGDYQIATTSTSYTANTWQHAAGVFATATSCSVYLNGGNKITDTTNVTGPTPLFALSIG